MPDQTVIALERPFYFTVVLWGARYRNYFLDYCLPSLLSVGNVPALATRQPNKFLIATQLEDWVVMKTTPIFRLMERYLVPVFIEIPPCPLGKPAVEHMCVGHEAVYDMAYRDKAYAVHVMPDCMLSEGTVSRLQELARQGKELVLAVALRFGEEPFLGALEATGAIPHEGRGDSGEPLSISGRQMVRAALNGLHSETLSYEWASPCFCQPYFVLMPSAAWWRVPGEDGIVVHGLSWAPLLLDYAAVRTHDSSTLKRDFNDGDYVYRNIGETQALHVVQDSDEAFIASWTPLSTMPHSLEPNPSYRSEFLSEIAKGSRFRNVFHSSFFNPLKRQAFFLTVRWHAHPINSKWKKIEHQATRTVHFWADPIVGPKLSPISTTAVRLAMATVRTLLGLILKTHTFARRISGFAAECWMHRAVIRRRIFEVLHGDREAARRVIWRIRNMGSRLMGRLVHAPESDRRER